jgi:hypothetical protein
LLRMALGFSPIWNYEYSISELISPLESLYVSLFRKFFLFPVQLNELPADFRHFE